MKPELPSVTFTTKRNGAWKWVFVCIGCGRLTSSSRSDATVCSASCRVRAHRSGVHAKRVEGARYCRFIDERTGRPLIARMGHIDALCVLRPDLKASLGEASIYQLMPLVYTAFIRQLFAEPDARTASKVGAP